MSTTDVAINIANAMRQNQHGGWNHSDPLGELSDNDAASIVINQPGDPKKYRVTVEEIS